MPWLIATGFLLIYEGYALFYNKKTLSRMMWEAGRAWPLFPLVWGMVVGGLSVHFWWNWCPK